MGCDVNLPARLFFAALFAWTLVLTLAGAWLAILTARAPQFLLLGLGLSSLLLTVVGFWLHLRWRRRSPD